MAKHKTKRRLSMTKAAVAARKRRRLAKKTPERKPAKHKYYITGYYVVTTAKRGTGPGMSPIKIAQKLGAISVKRSGNALAYKFKTFERAQRVLRFFKGGNYKSVTMHTGYAAY